MIPFEVLSLTSYLQSAFNAMKLKDSDDLTAAEIKDFKKDYSLIKSPFRKRKYLSSNAHEYRAFTSKILDYYIYKTPEIFLEIFSSSSSTGLKFAIEVVGAFNKAGFFSLGRYLGENDFPTFINDARIYKKMLWLEWCLTKLLNLIDTGIIPDISMPILGGTRSAMATRLTAAKKFIDQYIETTPAARKETIEFRKTYAVRDFSNSYLNALAAINPEEEKPEKNIKPDEKMESLPAKQIPKTKPAEPIAEPIIEIPITPAITLEELKEPEVAATFEDEFLLLKIEAAKVKETYWNNYLKQQNERTLFLLKQETLAYKIYLLTIKEENKRKGVSSEEVTTKLRAIERLSTVEKLEDFKALFKLTKKHLEKSRDTGTVKFLKAVATIFTAGLAALFGIWSVRGNKASTKMEKILKKPRHS